MRVSAIPLLSSLALTGCNAIFGVSQGTLDDSVNAPAGGATGASGAGGSSAGASGAAAQGGAKGGMSGASGQSGAGGTAGSKGGMSGASGASGGAGKSGSGGASAGTGGTGAMGGTAGASTGGGGGGSGGANGGGGSGGANGGGGSSTGGSGGSSAGGVAGTNAAVGVGGSEGPGGSSGTGGVGGASGSAGSDVGGATSGSGGTSGGAGSGIGGSGGTSGGAGIGGGASGSGGTTGGAGAGAGGSATTPADPDCTTVTPDVDPSACATSDMNDDSAACQTCAFNGPCQQLVATCANDPSCVSFQQCLSNSNPVCASDADACLFPCMAQFPAGWCEDVNVAQCVDAVCPHSVAKVDTAPCPSTASFDGGALIPSACVRLADFVPNPNEAPALDLCYQDGGGAVHGPMLAKALVVPLTYGTVSRKLTVPAQQQLTFWATTDTTCAEASEYSVGVSTMLYQASTVTLTQASVTGSAEGPFLNALPADAVDNGTNVEVRFYNGVQNTTMITADVATAALGGMKLSNAADGFFASVMPTNLSQLGIPEDMYHYVEVPNAAYAVDLRDDTGTQFYSGSFLTQPPGPAASGVYTVYFFGNENDVGFPPHLVICDDVRDFGDRAACATF